MMMDDEGMDMMMDDNGMDEEIDEEGWIETTRLNTLLKAIQ